MKLLPLVSLLAVAIGAATLLSMSFSAVHPIPTMGDAIRSSRVVCPKPQGVYSPETHVPINHKQVRVRSDNDSGVSSLLKVTRCGREACRDELEDFGEPPISVSGVESWRNVCLVPKGDRVVPKEATASDNLQSGITFLASDLCAMGHTTKDTATMLSYLLDTVEMEPTAESTLIVRLVYGNSCMTRNPAKVSNKRTPVFHSVLKGWFRAVGQTLSKLLSDEFQCPETLPCESCVALKKAGTLLRSRFSNLSFVETYFEDHQSSRLCYETVSKRLERWRWMRTSQHADIFRGMLHLFYNVTRNSNPKVRITVLRRDEDRHFDEKVVFSRLNASLMPLASAVELRLATFDNIRGRKGVAPPTHKEQLQILYSTDILIAAHGAGLASIAAMRAETVIVELLPNNFRYAMYEELALLCRQHYVGFESPVVWPQRCCRGGKSPDGMPPLPHPSHLHGVGARACKKCDIKLSGSAIDHIIRSALNTLILANHRRCGSDVVFFA